MNLEKRVRHSRYWAEFKETSAVFPERPQPEKTREADKSSWLFHEIIQLFQYFAEILPGSRSMDKVMRYSHPSDEHKAEALETLEKRFRRN